MGTKKPQIGDRVYAVEKTKRGRKRSFPDKGVNYGEIVSIDEECAPRIYKVRYTAPWGGLTSGRYSYEQIGFDEKDWAKKQ